MPHCYRTLRCSDRGGGRGGGLYRLHPQRGAGDMSMQDEPRNTDDRKGNGRGAVKMVGVALAAFAFTFSLVPMYRIACEKVFGVRLEKSAVDGRSEEHTSELQSLMRIS